MIRAGVLVVPGSICDRDMEAAASAVMGWEAVRCWHAEPLPRGLDVVLVPGGFSYGDYLRCGALAALSPAMESARDFARGGGLVLGVCNGFQILCEAGMLPGTLLRNRQCRFVCREVRLRVEREDTAFTSACGHFLTLPIAHGQGSYHADPRTLQQMSERRQILFRYVDAEGDASPRGNPNGSLANIAGVVNAEGNVAGMMPHPERAVEPLHGGTDGLGIFRSLAAALEAARA
jgi:phosphoribosylformylglycinamidine synthase